MHTQKLAGEIRTLLLQKKFLPGTKQWVEELANSIPGCKFISATEIPGEPNAYIRISIERPATIEEAYEVFTSICYHECPAYMGLYPVFEPSKTVNYGFIPTCNITEFSSRLNTLAHERGWWKDGIELHKKLMLIVSEASEAMEADRQGEEFDRTQQQLREMLAMKDEKEFIDAFEFFVKNKLPDEISDIVMRALDLGFEKGYDIALHMNLKHRYNSIKKPNPNKKY